MRQNVKRRERNYALRSTLKTAYKKALIFVKEGNAAELAKFMAHAFSIIDTAAKKKLIEPNNASRKKSRLARELNKLQAK